MWAFQMTIVKLYIPSTPSRKAPAQVSKSEYVGLALFEVHRDTEVERGLLHYTYKTYIITKPTAAELAEAEELEGAEPAEAEP
jgi:hypothetical protein